MEAMVDPVNETIWANQKAIAALFDVTVPNISYHFKKIFEIGELDAGTVVKDYLITAQSGARGTSEEKVKYYIFIAAHKGSKVICFEFLFLRRKNRE